MGEFPSRLLTCAFSFEEFPLIGEEKIKSLWCGIEVFKSLCRMTAAGSTQLTSCVVFLTLSLLIFFRISHVVLCSITSVPHFNDRLLWFLLRSLVCLGTLPGCWCRKLCLWGLQAWCLWGKASWEIPLQVHSKIFKALFAFWCYTFDKMHIPYLRKIIKCQNNWYTEKVIKQHTLYLQRCTGRSTVYHQYQEWENVIYLLQK